MGEFFSPESIIKPEQNEGVKPIHEVLERAQQEFVENCDLSSEDGKKRLREFLVIRGQITDQLKSESVDFQSLELWQRLVDGRIPEKTKVYDTPDKRVEA